MTTDTILQELWKSKDAIAKEHDYDVDLLANCLEAMRMADSNFCPHTGKEVLVAHEEPGKI